MGHVDHRVVRQRGLGARIFGTIESGLCLLVGYDGNVVGRKPSSFVVQEPIPPARFKTCEDFDDVALAKRKRRRIVRLIVVKSTAEESRDILLIAGALRLVVAHGSLGVVHSGGRRRMRCRASKEGRVGAAG